MGHKVQTMQLYAFVLLPALGLSLNVVAKPWLNAGDIQLRHELQILSDAGMLSAPLTTWPLASKDIHRNLMQPAKGTVLPSELLSVITSINKRLEDEDYGENFKFEVTARTKKLLIRDFSGEGREKSSASYDGDWANSLIDARLKIVVAEESSHPSDKKLHFDESYLASSLGNWKFTVGRQSRWWGPSWDGSLILSNNARPIPSISFEKINSEPFKNKYLRWIGFNKLHMFIGQLELNRGIPDAKLIGTRFTFKPLKSLEVGMHRTIQWGGKGQDNSFSSLLKTIANVKLDTQNGSLGSVASNQIAGLDVKWKLPTKGQNKYTLYGQYIGEDRVDGSIALGDETFLVGGSVSGLSKKLGGSWRAYLEATDTSAAWFKGRARNNIIYNHSAYKDGYRHLGVSMGHGIDSDSRMISAGAMLSKNNGDFWRGWVKHAKLNTDGTGINPLAPNGKTWSAAGVSLDRKPNKQTKLNLGLQYLSEKETGKSRDNDFGVSIGVSYSF